MDIPNGHRESGDGSVDNQNGRNEEITDDTASTPSSNSPSVYDPVTSSTGMLTPAQLIRRYDEGKQSSLLLVDARSEERTRETGLFKYSFNWPASTVENIGTSADNRLTTKLDIIKFISKNYPPAAGFLNAPGFFKEVVLYDEMSTVDSLSAELQAMVELIKTWNTGTGTYTKILHGGFYAMAQALPGKVIQDRDYSGHVHASWKYTIQKLQHWNHPSERREPSPEATLTINLLATLLENLDTACSILGDALESLRMQKSLKALRIVLAAEEEKRISEKLETVLPAELKCCVCTKLLDVGIYQCQNGHCIGALCISKQILCPVCKCVLHEPGIGLIRNTVAEKFMAMVSVECPLAEEGCGQWPKYGELMDHLEMCHKGTSPEFEILTDGIEFGKRKVQRLYQTLERVDTRIMETEAAINEQGELGKGFIPQRLMEQVFEKRLKLAKLKTAVNLESLMGEPDFQ